MEENIKNTAAMQKEKAAFEEPTCELVEFGFENILADIPSNGNLLEEDYN